MSKRSVNLLRKGMDPGMTANVDTLTVNGATRAPGLCPTTKTELAADAALSANVWYYNTHTGAADRAYTLPAAADSKKGDTIVVEYDGKIANGQTHKYGTSGEFFMAKSAVYRPAAVAAVVNTHTSANGTTHDFLDLIGLTNAGPGIGSELVFWFNGSTWGVNGRLASSGTGAAANASVFATS